MLVFPILVNLICLVPISANHGWNFDELLEKMWEYLDLVRVYTKPRGVQPDFTDPVVLRKSHCSVEDFCNTIVWVFAVLTNK